MALLYLKYSSSIDRVLIQIDKMERLCIYPKDIQIVTGRSERYGRNLIKKIKEHLKKQQHHLVTVDEFCQFTGLHQESVARQLR